MNSRIHRAELIDQQFIELVRELGAHPETGVSSSSRLADQDLVELFESQIKSRHLDLMARVKRQENKVFYTIGSSGHEGNALLGRLSRPTDPAFLHYRSGALMAERYRHKPELNFIKDTCLSLAAAATDPASGGRHKVWGHRDLWVLPQTSTIASHLPKALGTALAIESGRAQATHQLPVPDDAIVLCSFGDGSLNHATAQTTLNAASWACHQGLKCPVVFICEDNGWGISVPTPTHWVAESIKNRRGLEYFAADGLSLEAGYPVIEQALLRAREARRPVFIHLKTVRLMGHAGTDFEIEYRSESDLQATEAADPLLVSVREVLRRRLMSGDDILALYEGIRQQCLAQADQADLEPKLSTREAIVAPLAPLSSDRVLAEAERSMDQHARQAVWGELLPEDKGPKHMAILINQGLRDILIKYPQSIVFGEDVSKKGGVYTVTKGLWADFGRRRVFNTLLDETTILGLAQGYANAGFLPIPEIQYLAYFHNACDQIRGEACSLQFFSNQAFSNPMVVRIAGLGYQKGFGGHFHNDNSITALRDIPGIILGCPSRGDDAVLMLRTMMALAAIDGRVCAFIEPIALYMTKDLYESEDKAWSFDYPPPTQALEPFSPRLYEQDNATLLIVTYGNGVPMALRTQATLQKAGHSVSVLDLRWLKPLPIESIIEATQSVSTVLVADEGRPGGCVGETIISELAQKRPGLNLQLITAEDSYIPLGGAAEVVMMREADVFSAAQALLETA